MNEPIRRTLFLRMREASPYPATELTWSTPFELLVSVMLSARATDVSVNKVTQRLFSVANTPETILALGELGLKEHLKTIGLYNNKTHHLLKTCTLLIEEYRGEVPKERELLESLPGIGRKTANVILNVAFGEPTIAVDTHVFRVSNRTGLAPGKEVRAVEDHLLAVVPEEFRQQAHHWLILHGRHVCTARKPRCTHCLIVDLCEYPDKAYSAE